MISEPKDWIEADKRKKTVQAVQTLLLSKLKEGARDTIVQYIMDNEYIYTERTEDDPPMYIYRDGIYVNEARTYIRELCELFCGKAYTKNISNEVIARIEALTYKQQSELYDVKNPYLLPVLNGIIDIRTGERSDFTPKIIFFSKIPVTHDPTRDCPNIKKFLSETLNEDDIPTIQEQFGYTLLRAYPIAKAFLYTGMGRNGKSTLIQLQKEFLGPENVTGVALQDLVTDQYSASELFGKLACIGGDLSSSSLKHTGTFKNLTGGDNISVARKFMTRLFFRNYAKLIFSANQAPSSSDATDGFFSRWIIIEFPHKFYTLEEIENMDHDEVQNVKVADRELLQKLCTPEEMSGLLNWALEGYKRIEQKGNFTNALTTEKIKALYIRKSNSLAAFFQEHCSTTDPNIQTPKEDFRNAYHSYCKVFQLPIKNDKIIAKFMSDNEVLSSKSNAMRYWVGLKMNYDLGHLGQGGHDFIPLGKVESSQRNRKAAQAALDVLNISENTSIPDGFSVNITVDDIMRTLAELDNGEGVDFDTLFKALKTTEEKVGDRIQQMLLTGCLFEIRPGRLKVLK